MKKLLITSAAVFGMAGIISIANANIGANAESAGCNNDTIGATSGTTTLEAQWQANQINISWYNGDSQITPSNNAAGQCTYDQAITLPSNTLSKEGYTFNGWKKRSVALSCGLNNLDTNITTDSDYYAHGYDIQYNKDYCFVNGGTYNGMCASEDEFNNINVNEWEITFSYGTIKGISSCNNTSGSSAYKKVNGTFVYDYTGDAKSSETFEQGGTGLNCWCRITKIDDTECPETLYWAFVDTEQSNWACAYHCPNNCALYTKMFADFRKTLFGQQN